MPGLERWSPVSYRVIHIVPKPEETPRWIIILIVAEITQVSYINYVSFGCLLFSVFQVLLLST